ncbi:DUF7133 domain-containing protein [Verrucomicrobium spinosum]|uniref:DUF7133 domain-containing protein n=1 Tax=Verrucomicrobium spinosum TaxID=2736 RepID=UPI001C4831E9|nr:hypothetical protein [Verrucomicrobium spinosum]
MVLEDTNGDGELDSQKTVIEGLNIATSALAGNGGIWVMNPPYLLFYPDANRDDVPDGDPEVHLSGFGLEDTHAVANSLRFGPDGWLYGANGSTTTGNVSSKVTKNVKWEGQCLWRYHPGTHVFEIYGEGSGNPFSWRLMPRGATLPAPMAASAACTMTRACTGRRTSANTGPSRTRTPLAGSPTWRPRAMGSAFPRLSACTMVTSWPTRWVAATSRPTHSRT